MLKEGDFIVISLVTEGIMLKINRKQPAISGCLKLVCLNITELWDIRKMKDSLVIMPIVNRGEGQEE